MPHSTIERIKVADIITVNKNTLPLCENPLISRLCLSLWKTDGQKMYVVIYAGSHFHMTNDPFVFSLFFRLEMFSAMMAYRSCPVHFREQLQDIFLSEKRLTCRSKLLSLTWYSKHIKPIFSGLSKFDVTESGFSSLFPEWRITVSGDVPILL